MSKITPIPEPLPEDLNEIKNLIDERTAAIAENDAQIAVLNKSNDELRADIRILQDENLIRLNLKSRKEKAGTVEMVDGVAVTYDNNGQPVK